MKLLKEIRAQFSAKEWFHAIFCHIPTAGAIKLKPGATLTQIGEIRNFNDFHNHLINWRKEVSHVS